MLILASTRGMNCSGRGKSLGKGTKTRKCDARKNARNGMASLLGDEGVVNPQNGPRPVRVLRKLVIISKCVLIC